MDFIYLLQFPYNTHIKVMFYMKAVIFTLRVDEEIKQQWEQLYGELDINFTTAINVFLRQSLRVGGFPFEVRLNKPNQDTLLALLEAENLLKNSEAKKYKALTELKKVNK